MATTPRAKSRKHKIEPLDWTQAAQSPAFKGMVSFLDISPEEIRKRNQALEAKEEAPPDVSPDVASAASIDADIDSHTGRDAHPGSDAPTGSPVAQTSVPKVAKGEAKAKSKSIVSTVSDALTGSDSTSVSQVSKSTSGIVADPVSASSTVGDTHIDSGSLLATSAPVDEVALNPVDGGHNDTLPQSDAHIGSDALTGADSLIGSVGEVSASPDEDELDIRSRSEAMRLQSETPTVSDVSETHTGSASLHSDFTESASAPTTPVAIPTQIANRSSSDSHTGVSSVSSEERLNKQELTEVQSSGRLLSDAPIGVGSPTGFDSHTGSDTRIGIKSRSSDLAVNPDLAKPMAIPQSDTLRGVGASHPPVSESLPAATAPRESPKLKPKPSLESLTGSDTHTGSEVLMDIPQTARASTYQGIAIPGSESQGEAKRSQVATSVAASGVYAPSAPYQPIYPKSIARVNPVGASRPVSESLSRAEDDYYSRSNTPLRMVPGNVPSLNRKIRKCKLAQDGHSQGEEILYDKMWEAALADPANPGGSRTLRIGYAELAAKARMHRTNVRINLAGLRAKLAIEILDEHVSRDVLPRLYRIYSYKEILDRRKAAGLEYVIRKKSVIFVTPTGDPIPLEGLLQPSRRRAQNQGEALMDTANRGAQPFTPEAQEEMEAEIQQISEALNRYWTTDESAARQLLYACRRVRSDARIEEILFFVEEKLELSRRNPGVINPTGLILATVPQSFEGYAFNQFRRRHEEQLRIAREEEMRRQEQAKAMEHWLLTEIGRYQAILDDPHTGEEEKARAREMMKPLTSRFA